MHDLVETIEDRGYKIHIYYDTFPESPREWDNISEMVCFHSRYNLGDDHNFSSPADFIEWAEEQGDKIVILPLFLYDHGGITMSTGSFSCPWDSGQVGWIYTDLEILNKMGHDWKRWTQKRREKAIGWLKSDVETYDQYLTGDVYGFELEGPDGEELDSCWGFFGSDHEKSGLLDHVDVDWYIEEAEKKVREQRQSHYDRLKSWIRSNVQFEYRKPLTV